ncbi:MAG: ABC transporter ATP-binding protein [Bdellovibrionaceae bacterium]|nr:ABC transporter ATP-binding protein [Pseudobdellovibrionaceae bacterium]
MTQPTTFPLEVIDLKKNYGSFEAVRGLSFEVRAGEVFGLLGPNGAGKTTTISIVTTLEQATSGQVRVFGIDVAKNPLLVKRQFGVVHQEIINSGFFTVEELLQFQSGYHGLRRNGERIRYLLNKLGLYEHREKRVKQLSGGMKRRLMIAKALVHSPRLLLLDEPTAGVDITLRENLWDFVRDLKREGIAVLLTTHYLEEAELLCDRVGIVNRGRLEAIGETSRIVHQFARKKVILDTRSSGRKEIFAPIEKPLGDILRDAGVDPMDLRDIQVEQGRLEDAFRRLLTGDKAAPAEGAKA